MKSPWYARTAALDRQRCWNRVSSVVSLNVSSLDLGPTVRFQRLYRFFGDQLYNKQAKNALNETRKYGLFEKRTMQGSDLLRLRTFLFRMVQSTKLGRQMCKGGGISEL
jgi:ribosomal protein L34